MRDTPTIIRRRTFEALVIQALWIIIRATYGVRDEYDGRVWRSEAIRYFDEHGNQSKDAPAYRRERTFPDMPQGASPRR